MKVLIAEPEGFHPSALELLNRAGLDVTLHRPQQRDIPEALSNYDVFWFRLGFRIGSDELPESCRCQVLVDPVTGLDHIDEQACAQKNIKIIALRGEREFLKTIRGTAEHTIGLMLSWLRRVPAAAQHVLEGKWDRDLFQGAELYQKKVAVIGMGRLGSIVAQYLQAFGAEVVGYDPFVIQEAWPAGVYRAGSLSDAVDGVDIVSLHVALNEQSEHLINTNILRHFGKDTLLVNTSRSGIVDEDALADAIQHRRLGGYATDVLQGEPEITPEHPLISLANHGFPILVTPHIGGNTRESFRRTEEFMAYRLIEYLALSRVA